MLPQRSIPASKSSISDVPPSFCEGAAGAGASLPPLVAPTSGAGASGAVSASGAEAFSLVNASCPTSASMSSSEMSSSLGFASFCATV